MSIGTSTLIFSENPTWLTRAHSEIKCLLKNSFYINYSSMSSDIHNFFLNIGALPISKDTNGCPKLGQLLEHCFGNMENTINEN